MSQSLEKVASCYPCEQFENWKSLENNPSVILSVWEDGLLEIDSMRPEVIVLIHPNGKKGSKSCIDWTPMGCTILNRESTEDCDSVASYTTPFLFK